MCPRSGSSGSVYRHYIALNITRANYESLTEDLLHRTKQPCLDFSEERGVWVRLVGCGGKGKGL